jgi:hypothetical protein
MPRSMRSEKMGEVACPHTDPPDLGFLAAYGDAEDRMARGEKQRRCPVCHKYIWEEYYSALEELESAAYEELYGEEIYTHKGDPE